MHCQATRKPPTHSQMTGAKQDQQSDNFQPCAGIKYDQLNHDMEKLCFGRANDKQCKELAVAEVVRSCGLPSTNNSTAGMFVDHQDCKSKLVIDLDGFGKMCDEINSMEENEAEQGRLTSNAQAIKENVDKYVNFLKNAREDVFNKSVHAQSWAGRSVANYEIELLLRFEDIVGRLQKLSSLLDANEIELHNKLSTIKELSRQLQTLVRILERKLSKFLHEYIAAVANGAKSIKKERSIIVSENDMYERSEEEDDWKVVLPSSSATATQGDTQSKGRKNKKTKRANKGKRRKK